MRTFKQILKKPSAAARAMLEGLREAMEEPTFEINMGTFGNTKENVGRPPVCLGCAATCAIQKAFNIKFVQLGYPVYARVQRAEFCKVSYADMQEFEYAMDEFRCGSSTRLFGYFGYTAHAEFDERLSMTSENYEEQLPLLERIVIEMEEAGL